MQCKIFLVSRIPVLHVYHHCTPKETIHEIHNCKTYQYSFCQKIKCTQQFEKYEHHKKYICIHLSGAI